MSPPILTIDNISSSPYTGWHRATTDAFDGLEPSGYLRTDDPLGGRVAYVLGDAVAEGARAIDIYGTVDPGQSLKVILENHPDEALFPPGPVLDFGGSPKVSLTHGSGATVATEMAMVGQPRVNGAALEATWRLGCDDGWWVYLETRYYPGQPWVEAELSVYQSGRHPHLRRFLQSIKIEWGSSISWVVGTGGGGPHIENTWFTDGQMRVLPVLFCWSGSWTKAFAKMDGGIVSWGIQKLLPDGQPRQGTEAAVQEWARRHIRELRDDLHNWDKIPLGVSHRGPNTGDQEDQVFVGAEGSVYAPAGLLRYLTALKFANRPCHHLDTDGTVLRGDRHPGLRFWGMRPDPRFTVNLLGKPRTLDDGEAEGEWVNAFASHWLLNTPAAANRATGSPTVQRMLEHQAENYLMERPDDPSAMTSIIWQSREAGWECIAVLHLLREIVDPALRQRIMERFMGRWRNVYTPYLAAAQNQRGGVLDILVNDLRVGTGEWWHPWMQAVVAYGLDALGRYLVPRGFAALGGEMVSAAAWVAAKVVADAYPGGRYLDPLDSVALDGQRVVDRGTFADAWTPLAAAVLLRQDRGHQKARAICQAWADRLAGKADQSWLPPGLVEMLAEDSQPSA